MSVLALHADSKFVLLALAIVFLGIGYTYHSAILFGWEAGSTMTMTTTLAPTPDSRLCIHHMIAAGAFVTGFSGGLIVSRILQGTELRSEQGHRRQVPQVVGHNSDSKVFTFYIAGTKAGARYHLKQACAGGSSALALTACGTCCKQLVTQLASAATGRV